MRRSSVTVAVLITAVSLSTLDTSLTRAAVFSVGQPDGSIGNTVCMDVSGNNLGINSDGSVTGVPVIVYDCHAGPNQQFQWAGPHGNNIFALSGQRCLAVLGSPPVVVSSLCVLEAFEEQFIYQDGQIINLESGECLDATDLQNFTQLVANNCDGSATQQWQIK